MSYRVVFTQKASHQLDAIADWWEENRDRDQASRWYAGFSEKIWDLAENPERFSLAEENEDFPFTIRELHYGLSSRLTHRAVFTIREPDIVLVLIIRHLAQGRIAPEDMNPDDLR